MVRKATLTLLAVTLAVPAWTQVQTGPHRGHGPRPAAGDGGQGHGHRDRGRHRPVPHRHHQQPR